MLHIRLVLLTLAATCCPLLSAAEFQLAGIFTDHMVLQRQQPVAVWGTAAAGHTVHVRFGEQTVSATADAAGAWRTTLQPLPASATPATLTVSDPAADADITISDVLVGEVWLGSGQSNMAMQVRRALDPEQEAAAADLPTIRLFTEGSVAAAVPGATPRGEWQVCTPETASAFSATLFFFGRELHTALDVPVGLINSSVGGTPIESWISAAAQLNTAELADHTRELLQGFERYDEAAATAGYERQLRRFEERVKAGETGLRRPRNPLETHRRRGAPGWLFNGKINPLIPYTLRGIVWYQGENNANSQRPDLYRHQLPALIRDWRSRWNAELPFAWVQLPNYTADDAGWTEVRDGMLQTLSLPSTGMAITIDIGEAKDIHPKNKQDVGKRLSLWALADVYDRPVAAASGPIPAVFDFTGQSVTVTFRHAARGLQSADGQSPLGFELLNTDGSWHVASASVTADRVVVSSAAVSMPQGIRYAWAALPAASLQNSAGLPATPFRHLLNQN
jgi:sialate O-acetylesterase